LFSARDGFRLDTENPLQQRLLLLVLAHVVFGRGGGRGRPKKSENWTSSERHHLCALYIDIKSKRPRLSKSKIAELIASRWPMPKEVIRKQLSTGRRWIEHLERCEKEKPGSIQMYAELLDKDEQKRAKMLSYKAPTSKKLSK
jgi:hypothetical protein